MKQTTSLHGGILKLVIGLVLTTSLTILLNVWWATYQQAQHRMSKDIDLAQTVLAQTLNSREELLFTTASVLANDFGFRRAVASKDAPTITSALDNQSKRIGADLMAIFNLQAEVIATTSNSQLAETQQTLINTRQIEKIVADGGLSGFMVLNGKVYKTIVLSINAPTPIALSLVGFELNQALIEDLEKTVQLELKMIAKQGNQVIALSNNNRENSANNDKLFSTLKWHHLLFSNDALISQEFQVYAENDLSIELVLTQTVDKLISEFAALKTSVSIIIIIAAFFAFLVASLYASKLVKPLSQLSKIATTISAGNYQQKIQIKSASTEFSDLANAFKNMQSNISEREKEITYQAEHDPLTGLYTRYHAGYIVDEKLSRGEVFQAVAINIIGFRDINDVFGYQVGDLVLAALSSRISILGGTAAKFTGGEFLWFPDKSFSTHALIEVQEKLEQSIVENDVNIPVKLAFACIQCPEQADNAEAVFKRLNIVLDEAQLQSSRMLSYEDKFEHKYIRRLKIITQLKKALLCNSPDLSLHYQPKLHLASQHVNSVEALIRWTDAGLGFVPPDEFITIAEQAGLISEVTHWVIKRAIEDAQTMRNGNIEVCIAINLSAKDLSDPLLLPHIKYSLEKAELPSGVLSFEITESDLVEDPKKASALLQEYREQGYQLAIDDFGTGYSSLAYLKSFPVDTIKIDKSFVLELSQNKDDYDIVDTILQLASKFNLTVVAEGVEDKESLQILNDLGCTWAQGYYMCKPLALPLLIKWCEQNMATSWLEA